MLAALQIRDIVLIETLDLEFAPGLCVLTGETGAGKSIILEALGLALGGKGDRGLVRSGARQGSVTAVFDLAPDHPVFALGQDSGLEFEAPLVLRRVLTEDGRSRAFVNDQPVALGLLRGLGDLLVEIHGQHDDRGLLDPASHRALLDAFAGLEPAVADLAALHERWRQAGQTLADHDVEAARARADAEYLTHALAELDALAPEADEEETLTAERTLLGHAAKIAEAFGEAVDLVEGEGGVAGRLHQALRRLERVRTAAAGRLDPALEALDRAFTEVGEARRAMDDVARALKFDPRRLEQIEERLFALRAAARKHGCAIAALPATHGIIAARVAAIGEGESRSAALAQAVANAATAYRAAAESVGVKRAAAARKLDAAVARELKPLKLDKATFHTRLDPIEIERASPAGLDRVSFEVSTNPGAPLGSLTKIASGGELARFILALKVVLAKGSSAATLVFDEVDRGVGGAVAAAVGERLARLSEAAQILVVTHSPQVAARARHHWRISKGNGKGRKDASARTTVEGLDDGARREEIARMLSGAEITNEARAAADRLLAETERPS